MEKINTEVMGENTVPIVQSTESSSTASLDLAEAQGFDEKATKRLVRKLDWHLIPFLSLIYL
jgi:hypothetical protein